MIHLLKIEERYYDKLISGEKKCEVRFNDRDFQKGDTIDFNVKYDTKGEVTLIRSIESFKITHVLNFPDGLRDGWVELSVEQIKLLK